MHKITKQIEEYTN